MLNKKSVDDINVAGKKVLVRCDFNVPLKDGQITDENRLVAALPTIKKLIADGGKVILCSHLGKPKGEPKPELSLAPVAVRLSELLGQEVKFAADDNLVGDNAKAAVAAMKDGEVVLLQNTRYRAEETKNANIQKAPDEVDAFSNNSDKYSLEIANLKAQIVSGTDLTEEQKANNTKIENKIKNLKAKKEDALAKAKKNLEKVTVSETKKYEEVVINADKARNLNYQLQDMKAVKEADKSNVQYDAAQEVDDLTSFNKARKAFLSKKNKETAQALKDVYENIDSDSTKKIYEQYLKAEVDKYLK